MTLSVRCVLGFASDPAHVRCGRPLLTRTTQQVTAYVKCPLSMFLTRMLRSGLQDATGHLLTDTVEHLVFTHHCERIAEVNYALG